jgi:succinoglycan biosynthesis protein ExoA
MRDDCEVAEVGSEVTVSVLVPVLNEESAIADMLDRLLAQSFPAKEIILADGGSTDGTLLVLRAYANRDQRITITDNPGRLQGAGLNCGLAASTGNVLVRLDGHSFIQPDYIERCVALLESTGADVVGGRMVARTGTGQMAPAIQLAMSRKWGAGPARFHHAGTAGFVETVYLGTFRRESVERAGGWASDVGVNEDFDLNYRIRRAGGRIWYDPTLEVGYQPRETLKALARQYFRYGRSKSSMLKKRPGSALPRQLVPAGLLPLAAVAVAGPVRVPARALLCAYAVAVATSAEADRGHPAPVRRRAAMAAFVMHWTWSAGFWAGLASPFPPAGMGGSVQDAPAQPMDSHEG